VSQMETFALNVACCLTLEVFLFVVYLTMLSLTQYSVESTVWMIVNNELQLMREEAVMS
jgi:hypothetical protein